MKRKIESLPLADMAKIKGGEEKGDWYRIIDEDQIYYIWLADKNKVD